MAIVRIQLRRDTAADWTSANPVLAEGEMGIETDTDLFKIGDGSTAWTSLGYGGLRGVAAATSPITYDSGTQTVGIDESAISIAASQISDVTATAAEINILDGVTATAAELNILDGVTATAAELNILDGVTATAAELNTLDGITATVTELNYTDGVTSAIQTQLDAKAPLKQTITDVSSSRSVALTDDGDLLRCTATLTLTVDANTGFLPGTRIDIVNHGTGTITFAEANGMSIYSKDSALTLDTQFTAATLLFKDANEVYLIGDLA